jgi:hypothetical protein
MNRRIDKLLVNAGAYFGGEGAVYDNFDPKKFAELIVQECLDLLWNSLSISADHVGTVDGIEYTGKEILTAAKEHFFWS